MLRIWIWHEYTFSCFWMYICVQSCVCMCVLACATSVGVCIHAQCAFRSQRTNWIFLLRPLSLLVWVSVSHWNGTLSHRSGYLAHARLQTLLSLPTLSMLHFIPHKFWGFELIFSHMQGKYFINWAISPTCLFAVFVAKSDLNSCDTLCFLNLFLVG